MLQHGALQICQIDACRLAGVNEVLAVLFLANHFQTPVCPHAGGVGLCEYAQHLAMIDYIWISGSLDGRMLEYVDHLHEHFKTPVTLKNGRYLPPTEPGYSIEMKEETLETYRFPKGKIWQRTTSLSANLISYGTANSDSDLQQILNLQRINSPQSLSPEEIDREGFVTVQHDLPLLQKMNTPHPHIVARHKGNIVGYALVMQRTLSDHIPILTPMFEQINKIRYQGHVLKNCKYVVMGQVCIAKVHRGKGLFADLYREMASRLKPHFDYIITEISPQNPRSLKAHYKVGFQKIHTYQSLDGADWVIVLLHL